MAWTINITAWMRWIRGGTWTPWNEKQSASLPKLYAGAWHRALLACVILAACLQSLYWVFLVPIYENPDEPVNLDYALAINEHRGLFVAHNSQFDSLPPTVHPYTHYLVERVGLAGLVFRPDARVSSDYGTPEYYAKLDRDAPPRNATPISGPNRAFAVYPFGYYAALALWIECLHVYSDKPVFVFFGCRVFSVVLFAGTLWLIHATLRLLRYRPWSSLGITAGIAFFPMVTFVTASIQVDNLSFLLVSLSAYLAIRARRRDACERTYGWLGIALAALLVTKQHFWMCVVVCVAPMFALDLLAARATRWRMFRSCIWFLVPSMLSGGVYYYTIWGTPIYHLMCERPTDWLSYAADRLQRTLVDYYAGSTHISFYGRFGWLDTVYTIKDARATTLIQNGIQAATWIVVALTLSRLEQVTARLLRVVRKGRWLLAGRVLTSNPIVNGYFLFTLVMIALYVCSDNHFGAQGRNWLPFMLGIVMVGVTYAPRALVFRQSQQGLSGLLLAGLLLYGAAAIHYGPKSVRTRYYQRAPVTADAIGVDLGLSANDGRPPAE